MNHAEPVLMEEYFQTNHAEPIPTTYAKTLKIRL